MVTGASNRRCLPIFSLVSNLLSPVSCLCLCLYLGLRTNPSLLPPHHNSPSPHLPPPPPLSPLYLPSLTGAVQEHIRFRESLLSLGRQKLLRRTPSKENGRRALRHTLELFEGGIVLLGDYHEFRLPTGGRAQPAAQICGGWVVPNSQSRTERNLWVEMGKKCN